MPAKGVAKLMAAEHVARYQLASQVVRGRSVLDAACGAGYGSLMLARNGATSVTGVDLAAEALPDSTQGASFAVGDLGELPFSDSAFDCVVCFEAIEHVTNPEVVIDELARVLASGGLLLISTPNGRVNPPGNPYHVHEYEPDEFRDVLGARFPHVATLAQHPFAGSLIEVPHNPEETEPATEDIGGLRAERIPQATISRLQTPELDQEQYLIAVASDEPLTCLDSMRSIAVLGSAVELRQWYDHLESTSRNERAAMTRAEEAERRATGLEAAARDASRQTADAYRRTVSWRITRPLRSSNQWITRIVARTRRVSQGIGTSATRQRQRRK